MERREGKTKLRDRVRVIHSFGIRQPQYQQLKVEGHLRVCGNWEFQIFPLLQMRSEDRNQVKLRNEVPAKIQNKIK